MATGKVAADEVEIVGGAIGAFEIYRDGAEVFSKLKTDRFPDDAEVTALAAG